MTKGQSVITCKGFWFEIYHKGNYMNTVDRTLNSRQVAAALGKQRNFIDRRASAGALSFTTVKRERRYNLEEVRRELADKKKNGKQSLSTFGEMHDLDARTVGSILRERGEIAERQDADTRGRGRFYPSASGERYSDHLAAIGTAMHRD